MGDRAGALDAALSQIERQFGKGSLMRMSDEAQTAIPTVSTGCLSLDVALGVGGLPRGRIVEIFGPEASGKTTLVYHVIAEAQRTGGVLRIHRCRARDGSQLRAANRRQRRRAPRLAARQRRASARDRRTSHS